ncbi:DUF1918 domain-containing protein [Streptomyces sp. NPDC057680]|uniref:DUF1918 domain-containing protein n=1 Tax=Streptomyces sp. NPDC057680 TaxID=3346208 RepID=UPI0036BED76D
MWARVGDRLIVGGAAVGDEGRDGEIVGLHHPDGTPPFDVRWSDTGRVTEVFPGAGRTRPALSAARHVRGRTRQGRWAVVNAAVVATHLVGAGRTRDRPALSVASAR